MDRQRLAAVSVSRRIAPLLSQRAEGSVVAAFTRNCYLELAGRLIAVVDGGLLNGPLNLVVSLSAHASPGDMPAGDRGAARTLRPARGAEEFLADQFLTDQSLAEQFPPEQLRRDVPAGTPAAIREGVIRVGGRWEIDTRAAAVWHPHLASLTVSAAQAARLKDRVAVIRSILETHAPRESLAHSDARPPRAERGMVHLEKALRDGDAAMAARAAEELAGLGQGLTPSGDDVLAGAMTALTLTPSASAATLRRSIAEAVRGRTTRISEAYLDAAAVGEAGEAWHRLAAVLAHDIGAVRAGSTGNASPHSRSAAAAAWGRDVGSAGDGPAGGPGPDHAEAALRTAIFQILAFGETSGADMLAGFVLGMTALL